MLSFVRRPVLPPCPNPDTGTRGRVELPDDVVLTILEHAQLPPDRLAQLRRTSKQFKKICEGNALWRPWWSCAPRWPDDGAQAIGPSAIYDDMMRQPQRARKDFAQLGRLKNKPLYHFGRDEVATIARRNLDNQRVFFLAVEINPEVLQMAPPSWLRDEAAMTGAIAANRFVLGYAPQWFKENPIFVAKALRAPTQPIDMTRIWKTDDPQLLLEAIRDVGPEVLIHASRSLQDDVTFMAQAVAIHSLCLKYATGRAGHALQLPLKAWLEDHCAMARAIEQNGEMLQYAPEPMLRNRRVLVTALRSSTEVINYTPNYDLADDDLILDMATQVVTSEEGDALLPHGASRSWARAIRYAPRWVREDADLILEGLTPDNGDALLPHVSRLLKGDRFFWDRAIQKNGSYLWYAADFLFDDRSLVRKSMRHMDPQTLQPTKHGQLWDISNRASPRLQDDRKLMLEAVQFNGLALGWASWRLQADKEVVLAAVKNHGYAIVFAAQKLQNDRDVLLASYRQKAEFLARRATWSPEDAYMWGIPDFAQERSDKYPRAFREDREVVLAYYAMRAHMPRPPRLEHIF